MSDNLPLEIQSEIMKRLPIKSLLQFRSVSKSWKSLIDSSHFIAHYHTQKQHILTAHEHVDHDHLTYLSIADDETFPKQKVSPTVPSSVNMLKHAIVIGSSHGLVCLQGVYTNRPKDPISKRDVVVLWNISIRKAVPVVVPHVVYGTYGSVIGFGVCRGTTDPKIVKIAYIERESDIERISCIPWQVEVFTLSTGVWRRPYSSNLPRKSIQFDWRRTGEDVDGFLYWLASDTITMDGGYTSCNLIISFDITTEEFREINLPCSLSHEPYCHLTLCKLGESLVVLQHDIVEACDHVSSVWMMEDGVPKLFTKLYTLNFNLPDARITTPCALVTGFRKSGEPIIEISEDDRPIFKLVVYDPDSKLIDYLGIEGIACAFYVYPYMETLLLLDQPNHAANHLVS